MLHGAADEILATLKNDRMKDPDRQKDIASLLGPLADEKYAQMVAIGKLITDWTSPEAVSASLLFFF